MTMARRQAPPKGTNKRRWFSAAYRTLVGLAQTSDDRRVFGTNFQRPTPPAFARCSAEGCCTSTVLCSWSMRGSDMEPVSFAKAKADTHRARRHLLLGNGFSSGRHEAFGYPSLYRYTLRQDPSFARLFPDAATPNFEDAIRGAADTQEVDRIREALIRAVAAVHPHYSLDLTESECRTCRLFLQEFIGNDRPSPGWLFSTNYDLLLHWVLSRQAATPGVKQHKQLAAYDGFERNGEWHPFSPAHVFYLHGAVHIFQRPFNALRLKFATEMIRYEESQTWLMIQVAERMAKGELPVFIAEGSGSEKRASIQRLDYPKRAWNRLKNMLSQPDDVLFTFGHSFGESDNHITEQIAAGAIGTIYYGIFSVADAARAKQLKMEWAQARTAVGRPPIAVHLYDVQTCAVWGSTTRASELT